MRMGRLRRKPLKISLPNRNRNIIRATQPQNPTVAYNGPTHRGELDYSRPRPVSAVRTMSCQTPRTAGARSLTGMADASTVAMICDHMYETGCILLNRSLVGTRLSAPAATRRTPTSGTTTRAQSRCR